ncbi:peptidoglycan -binding protein [Pannonibacter sp. Pt2-lr]
MAGFRGRRRNQEIDYWPSFVDALTTLLLVLIFLLSIFVIAQFVLSQQLSGRDSVLSRLNAQISELTELLSLERASKRDLESTVATLQASLGEATSERDRLSGLLSDREGAAASAGGELAALQGTLNEERQVSQRALAQVELLNQQIAALRRQLAAANAALEASEAKESESQARIASLGQRLNAALVQRVQELNRYRSDFFGRLRELLPAFRYPRGRRPFRLPVRGSVSLRVRRNQPERPGGAGQAGRSPSGARGQIPSEIQWVLRVDGHTDAVPLSGTGRLRDNWELSSARATSVVRYLISKGVDPKHLVAAGFGEFQPLEPGNTPEINARNRRIELKLTER